MFGFDRIGITMTWKEFVHKYDTLSFRNWLVQKTNISFESIALAGIFSNLEPFLDSSLIEIILDECVYGNSEFDFVVEGFDRIPRALLEDLSDDVIYKARVSEIKHDDKGVAVRSANSYSLQSVMNLS